jgi:hypothetical protein
VAQRVVDVLEVVEVEGEHRQLLAAANPRERIVHPDFEHRAVGKAGQGVVGRHVGDLGGALGHPLLEHDAVRPHQRQVAAEEPPAGAGGEREEERDAVPGGLEIADGRGLGAVEESDIRQADPDRPLAARVVVVDRQDL